MKAKFNFDSAKLKELAFEHGEKAALGVGVLVAVLVIWSGLAIEGYTRTSKELQTAVSTGRSRLEKSHENPPGGPPRFDIKQDQIKVPDPGDTFSENIDRELIHPIDPSRYAGMEYNRPLFETKQRRREPAFIAVRDLHPSFAYGAVSYKGGESDKGLAQGEQWIAVTGIVPFDEQTAAYTKAFQQALDPTTNAVPVYRLYEIRRAEVTDPSEAIDWNKIQPLNLQKAVAEWMAKWSKFGDEKAPLSTVSWPPLTEPLPPLTNAADYGTWCVHPALAALPGAASPVATPVAPPPQPAVPADNPFGLAPAPAAAPAPVPEPAAVDPAAPVQTKQLLFRFIDFNIEPGKTYRYQVKLILNNPNYNLDLAHLEKPELAQRESRESPWSDPSPPIQVPYVDRYYADDVKGASGDLEPFQSVTVRWWFPQLAADGFIKFESLMRGARLSSLGDATISYAAPGSGVADSASLPFNSGAMLLDFSWERPEAKLRGPSERPLMVNRPAEALLINPRGQLLIRSQLMDRNREGADMLAAAAAAAPAAAVPAAGATPAPAPATGGGLKLELK